MTTTQPVQPQPSQPPYAARLRRPGDAHPQETATTEPLGTVVATSLIIGLVLAAVLVAGPASTASEARVIGAALLAFAVGWAMMAVATTRFTRRPQRWAAVPAALLGLAGAALLAVDPGEPAMTRLAWVWAPGLVVLAIFVARQARSHVGGARAALIYPVTALMFLAGVGGLFEATTQGSEAAVAAMPGQLYDVGGYRLHLSCTGSGSPTVILLNGLQETSPHWARIAPRVAPTTRVCAYDRAGQGWSEDSNNPADATHVATDLHALLAAAGEQGPYVLAGHSSGGVYAMTYAARYPADVAGMVLLDSSSPRQVELMPAFNGQYQVVRRIAAVAPSIARTGIWHAATSAFTATLPGAAGHQGAVFAVSPRGLRNLRAEQMALPTSFRQAQALTSFGDRPLAVLTSQDSVDRTAGWGTAQNDMATLSTNVRHVIAPFSHGELLADPDGAALSALAITGVVASVRTGAPLTSP